MDVLNPLIDVSEDEEGESSDEVDSGTETSEMTRRERGR